MTLRHLLATAMLWLTVMTIGQTQNLRQISLLYPNASKPTLVTAEVEDDFLIIEGDIIVGTTADLLEKGVVINSAGNHWPDGSIPYEIEANHPAHDKIIEAIETVNSLTNICLFERTIETSYVFFKFGNRCSSYVGKMDFEQQPITLANGCSLGTIIHEIMHTAGFYHEHTRSDRDHYITVHEDEIKEGFESNFAKHPNGQDIGEYDYASLMHYGNYSFTRNGVANITINMPPGNSSTVIGQRDGLSEGDIASINTLYPQKSDCKSRNLACHKSGVVEEMENNIVHWYGPSISNLGSTPSDSVTVGIFLSTNDYIAASTDRKIGEITLPGIPVGDTLSFDYEFDFTDERARFGIRDYYFGLVIDIDHQINELNERDNAGCASFFKSDPNITDGDDNGFHELAVNLTDFSVQLIENSIAHLEWTVEDEINFSHYEIERSIDGKNWSFIQKINAQGGDDSPHNYAWKDAHLPTKSSKNPIVYYRLKMIDKDKSFEYSDIRNIENTILQTEWTIYPNPSTGNINIVSSQQNIEHYLIKITDFTGKVIYQINETLLSNKIGLNLSHLPTGIYWLQVGDNTQIHTEKIVLN